MKALPILSVLAIAACASTLMAAPVIEPSDISEDTLRGIATDRQKKSLDDHAAAQRRAEKAREEAEKDVKKVKEDNDKGMKKTIQRRHLNTMLPPCERTPETPREPGDYTIRPEW